MQYDPTTHTLVLGKKDCYCGDGTQNGRKDCPTCKGTGNGPRGGARKCRPCMGSGWLTDPDNPVTHDRCGGAWEAFEDESLYDFVDGDIVRLLPVVVRRLNRGQSFLEAYIGVGLYSATDYGRAWDSDDDEALIAKVREDYFTVQGTKIARKTADPHIAEMCNHILIDVHPNGYNVVGVFTTEPAL
jgi:hypothetical protein